MDTFFGEKIIVVKLNDLPANNELEGPEPDNEFMKSIDSFDIIVPIILTRVDNKYVVVDGRRRIKAARKMNKEEIKAVIYDNLSPTDTATWALILNEQRSMNIITEFRYYRELMKDNRWEEMYKQYGFNKAHIEKILTLGNIKEIDQLVSAYESGKISDSTLFEIAKLGEKRQSYILKLLRTKGKLSMSDVKETQKLGKQEAIDTMPKFDEVSAIPEENNSQEMLFAVVLPGVNAGAIVATIYSNAVDAYAAKEDNFGSRLFRLVEV